MNRVVALAACVLLGCGARTIVIGSDDEPGAVVDSGVIAVIDSGTPMADSGIVVTDAAPVSRPIACGAETCQTATDECCVPLRGGSPSCLPKGGCDDGAALSCSSSVSCAAGESCCLDQNPDSPSAVCKSECVGGRGGELTLCAKNDECPAGTRCRRAAAGLSACIRG